MIVTRTHSTSLLLPYRGLGSRWFGRGVVLPPPRLVQLVKRLRCLVCGHSFSGWRVETEDWFEYVSEPQDYAWRTCQRHCGAMECVREV